MPLYEYRCPNCTTSLDLRRAVDERDSQVSCPMCTADMDRVPTAGMAIVWAGKFQGRAMKKQDLDGLGSEW